MTVFQKALRKAIEASKLSDRDVAQKAGISNGALSHYRHGKYAPKVETVDKLAEALGVRSEYLLTGKGLMGADTWSVGNRALYDVDGILADDQAGPTLGEHAKAVKDEFYEGFKRQTIQKTQYLSLSLTVHVIFGNLLARAMNSFRERKNERVSDPKWRGDIAGRLLIICQGRAEKVDPRTGFDQKPWSTRAWIHAMAKEMKEWEDDGQIHTDFEED